MFEQFIAEPVVHFDKNRKRVHLANASATLVGFDLNRNVPIHFCDNRGVNNCGKNMEDNKRPTRGVLTKVSIPDVDKLRTKLTSSQSYES